MRNVAHVCKDQLQRMGARFEFNRGFRLAFSKVTVVVICRNRLVEWGQRFCIYQQVVMAGIRVANTCRRNAHALQTKLDGDRT